MSHGIVASVDQICYMKCLAVTPHDMYSTCRVCGYVNKEKKSHADYEADKKPKLADSWDYGM